MNTVSKRAGLFILCILLVLLPGGCAPAKAAKDGAELNVHLRQSPATIDPQLISDVFSSEVSSYYTGTLYEADPERNLIPGLAESSEVSEDGLTVTYHIRDGLLWSDGRPLTAEDFVYGLQRLADPETKSNSVYLITDCCAVLNAGKVAAGELPVSELGVYAPDYLTLVIRLEQPCPYLNALITMPCFSPCNREFFASCGGSYATSPETLLSCGPYTLDRYEPLATQIHFTKNPYYYHADRISLSGVNLQVIENSQQAIMCYEAGLLDIAYISGELAEIVEGDSHLNRFSTAAIYKIDFNQQTHPQLINRNIRLGMAKSIDRETIVKKVLRMGYAPLARVNPAGYYFESDGQDFAGDQSLYDEYMKYDPEKAAEYWAKGKKELGVDTVSIEMVCKTDMTNVAEALKVEMENHLPGLKITLTPLPLKELLRRIWGKTDYDILMSGWSADYTDPTSLYQPYLSLPGSNGYSNSHFDEVYNNTAVCKGEERNSLLHEAEDILMQDVALIPLFNAETDVLIRDNVSGFQTEPTGVGVVVTGLKKEIE